MLETSTSSRCVLCQYYGPIRLCSVRCKKIIFLLCTERWLTPGTEYAVTEKLPLPRGWYTERDADVAAGTDSVPSHGAAGGTDVDESGVSHRQHIIKIVQDNIKGTTSRVQIT